VALQSIDRGVYLVLQGDFFVFLLWMAGYLIDFAEKFIQLPMIVKQAYAKVLSKSVALF
jgi:hypothetical protein